MTEPDSERFRREADDCREMAARATIPQDKAAWLKLAGEWLSLRVKTCLSSCDDWLATVANARVHGTMPLTICARLLV